MLVALVQYAEAEKELQRVVSLGGPDVPMAYRFLGALYNEKGDYRRAVEALEKYLELAPKAKDSNSVRSIIKELKDKLEKTED